MTRPKSRKALVKELDRVFSLWIRYRDSWTCVTCGKKNPDNRLDSVPAMTCGHLLTRVAYSTRWNPLNAACQCAPCNGEHERRPHKFTQWFLHKHGQEMYDRLIALHNRTAKYTNIALLAMIQDVKRELYGKSAA